MDIMELGAIGELVGGVAVIGSLIYLAIQVKQGNEAWRTEAHRALAQEWTRASLGPVRELELASRCGAGVKSALM